MPISTPALATPVVTSANNVASVTSDSFTPAGNALIVVFVVLKNNSGGETFDGFSSTFATGGWTTVAGDTAYGSVNMKSVVGWAIADPSPGAGTVTATWSVDTVNPAALHVIEIGSGFDTTTPIRQSGNTGAASGTSVTGALGLTPLSGSVLLAAGAGNAAGGAELPVQASGWTELAEDQIGGINHNSQHVAGSNGTGFGISFTGDQTGGIALTAIEVQEAASGDTANPEDVSQTQQLDAATISEAASVSPAALEHQQSLDTVTIAQAAVLSPADLSQSMSLENAVAEQVRQAYESFLLQQMTPVIRH